MKEQWQPSVEAMMLSLTDQDKGQAIAFLDHAIEAAPNELAAIRMRWLREYLLSLWKGKDRC